MAKINPLTSIWTVVKEADLRPIRAQAERGLRVAIVGAPNAGRERLAERMRRDPARPDEQALGAPVGVFDLNDAENLPGYDLLILMLDGRRTDTQREQDVVRAWHGRGQRTLVFVNDVLPRLPAGPAAASAPAAAQPTSPDAPAGSAPPRPAATRTRGVVRGSVLDDAFLSREFAPAVLELVPEHVMALGRSFPFFRVPVAQYLINDASFSNAAYAFSTSLAETVPVVSVPIAVADMIILTKNQLFLVYKLGLALGYSTRWQDYVAEFGSVLGSSFLWRQAARALVGLIPVWGIVPKTAISYAGTYAVGNAVLQWYLTGRHVSPEQVKQLYTGAFERGKQVASGLISRAAKLPRPRLARPRQPRTQESAGKPRLALPKLHLALPHRRRPAPLPDTPAAQTCPNCGKISAGDAHFCQYCGRVF